MAFVLKFVLSTTKQRETSQAGP